MPSIYFHGIKNPYENTIIFIWVFNGLHLRINFILTFYFNFTLHMKLLISGFYNQMIIEFLFNFLMKITLDHRYTCSIKPMVGCK